MTCTSDPTLNQLLAALPAEALARWRNKLELVELHLGQVLCESGRPLGHVYFPCTAIVSLLYVTESGQSAEIAVVGNEGVIGIALFPCSWGARRRSTGLWCKAPGWVTA